MTATGTGVIEPDKTAGTTARARRFALRLGIIALIGLIVRLVNIVLSRRPVRGDGTYYHAIAAILADGKGFIAPGGDLQGRAIPWAPHPPLWPVLLAVPARLGLRTYTEQQLFAVLIGVATVVVVGFTGRRLAGARTGLVAAAIAALYPNFFLYERDLLAETLALLLVAIALLLAYRFMDRPGPARAVALGATCGLLALTRSEQALLLAFLLTPVVLSAKTVSMRRRVTWLAASVAVALALIAPWTIYNTLRFRDPVILSHELGPTMAEANCDESYNGPDLGYRSEQCRLASPFDKIRGGQDGSTRDSALRREAIDYVRDHLGRVPIVVLAREGRAWGLFRPTQQARLEAGRGTPVLTMAAGFAAFWALVVAAGAGLVMLHRARVRVFPLLAPLATALVGVALTFGSVRYRAPSDVSIVLLAAVAITAAIDWLVGPAA